MEEERFEWNDSKAAANYKKHKISFEAARLVFDDPYQVWKPDDHPDEDRDLVTGMARDLLLTVCCTERGYRIRIISARRANSNEQNSYFTQDPQDE